MRLIDADVLPEISLFGTTEYINVNKAPTVNAIPIPEGATNGDMIKALFPNLRVEDNGGSIYLRYPDGGWIVYDRKWWNWWNAPYKKGSEDKK